LTIGPEPNTRTLRRARPSRYQDAGAEAFKQPTMPDAVVAGSWVGSEQSPAAVAVCWTTLRGEARALRRAEPVLAPFLNAAILRHANFKAGLANDLAMKLANADFTLDALREIAGEAFAQEPEIIASAVADLLASKDRNPAYRDHLTPFLYFKGLRRATMASRRPPALEAAALRTGDVLAEPRL